ncbi:anaerobic sulfatase maturase AslB, partial [Klebsiella pneumoniae]|nr:anaerobic sulfatase maturase AslB [Klebsiella pneumoniae]
GLNYLCAGYQRYFRHLPPYLKAMSDLLAHGRPASDIMHAHLLVVSK